jgi:phage-related minor tail protein
MATRERSLEIAIKARDEYSKKLKAAQADFNKFADAQNAASRNRKAQVDALQGIRAQRKAYQDATNDVAKFKRAVSGIDANGPLSQEDAEFFSRMGHGIAISVKRAQEAKRSLAEYREELHRLRGVKQGDMQTSLRRADAIEQEAAATRNAAAEQRKLVDEQRNARVTQFGPAVGPARLQAAGNFDPTGSAKRDALLGVRAARATLAAAQREAQEYGKALKQMRNDAGASETAIAKLNAEFERSRAAVTKSKAALLEKQATLHKLKGATQSNFADSIRHADAMEREAMEARQLGEAVETTTVKLRRVSGGAESSEAAQRRLAREIRGTTAQMRAQAKVAGETARKELAAYRASINEAGHGNVVARKGLVDRIVGSWGTQHGRGPLGLRPYELTNLSYQVNDVISGLAMGQAPMQVFAQQAGQIIQIFPKMAAAILRLVPAIAVMTPFALALARIGQETSRLSAIQRDLDLMAQGFAYDAREIKAAADDIDDAGASFKDAHAAMKAFLGENIGGDLLAPLGNAAQNMAKLTDGKLPEVAERFATAFGNGIEGVRELDQEIGFLTAEQYENIRAMAESGQEAEALAIAAGALEERLASVSGELEGMSLFFYEAGRAWDAFIGNLAKSDILVGVAASIGEVGKQLGLFADGLNDAASGANKIEVEIDPSMSDEELDEQIAKFQDAVNANNLLGFFKPALSATGLADDFEAMRDDANARLAALEEERRRRENIVRETNNQAKAEQDIQGIVDETVKSLGKQVEQSKLTSREREIQKALDETREAAQKRANELGIEFLGLTQEQTAAIREQAGALYDRNNALSSKHFEKGYTQTRFAGGGAAADQEELVVAVTELARKMDWSAKDLLTVMSYETAGTFDPWKAGPTTQWGQHRGLIQWGEPQAARYGVDGSTSVYDQVMAAGEYLVDSGVKAGDGLLQMYAAVNAGDATKVYASDVNNGGAPGTVLDKVNGMGDHAARAEGLLAAYSGVAEQTKAAADAAEKRADEEERARERAEAFHASQAESLELAQLENSLANATAEDRAAALAVKKAEISAQRAGTELTVEERRLIEETAREKARQAETSKVGKRDEKERREALKQAKQLEAEITRLKERQKFLQEERRYAADRGDSETIAHIDQELSGINSELDTAIDKAIAFWRALGGEGSEAAIQKLQHTRSELGRMGKQSVTTADQMNDMFTGAILGGLETFAQAIAEGKGATEALGLAFRQMASEVLLELGRMILKQMIFNAISGMFGGAGLGGQVAGAVNGIFFHDGGKVGSPGHGKVRPVPVSAFASAVRYHSGGIAGLKPNEVTAVLEEGEEVLTATDPRHRDNIGKGVRPSGGGGMGTIINAFDAPSFLESALESSDGGEVFVNYVRANRDTIVSILEGG